MVLLRYLDSLAGHVYSTLIVTRTDLVYACNHPPLYPLRGEIYVQHGEGGKVTKGVANSSDRRGEPVSDRHSIMHFDDRHRALEVLPWLVRYHPRVLWTPELALGQYYAHQELRVHLFDRVNFAVRRPAVDGTRRNWDHVGSVPCGKHRMKSLTNRGEAPYLAKYSTEHALAVSTCKRDPCTSTLE